MLQRPKPARQKASERARRYRARQNAGQVIAPVPVSLEVIGLLLDLRWLAEIDAESRDKIGLAIASMLGDAAKKRHA
jgi:hypothetical protein